VLFTRYIFQSPRIGRDLLSPIINPPRIRPRATVEIYHVETGERRSKSGRYVCTRVRTCAGRERLVQVAWHISPRLSSPQWEVCWERGGGRRGRTRALDNGVTRNGTRRAAKCIMPGRRLQRASGAVHNNGAKRGVAPRSIDLAFVFFLSFFPLLLSLLSPRSADTHKWSQRLRRERPIHEIYQGNRSVTLQREKVATVTALYRTICYCTPCVTHGPRARWLSLGETLYDDPPLNCLFRGTFDERASSFTLRAPLSRY